MDEERIERALRHGPPDEGRYMPADLDLLVDGPPSPPRPVVRSRSALPAWLVVGAVVLVVGLAVMGRGLLPGSQLGGGSVPAASPTPSGSEAPPATAGPSAGTERAIPWLDQPVAVPPEPTPITITPPPGIMPCAARGLTALLTGFGYGMGTTYTSMRITNTSAGTCYLQGTPGAQVIDGQGRIVLDGTKATGAVPVAPGVMGADPVVVLVHGASTDLAIGWSDWCGPAIKGPFSFAIVLPRDGGRLAATWARGVQALQAAVTCMGGSSSEVFSPGPFAPPPDALPASPEPTPSPLQVAIGNLATGALPLGAPIRYTVTLTNVTGAPLDLRAFAGGTTCPTYEEQVLAKSSASAQAYTLNCSSLGPIAPGTSVTFAMQMSTAGLTAGNYVLAWTLAPDMLGPSAKFSLTLR